MQSTNRQRSEMFSNSTNHIIANVTFDLVIVTSTTAQLFLKNEFVIPQNNCFHAVRRAYQWNPHLLLLLHILFFELKMLISKFI